MKDDVQEVIFTTRDDFRKWLYRNAETSTGVWLVFGKAKTFVTLTAQDALEEALCFGWIDGQMESIDRTKYRKYFACRRSKSPWSDKNKRIIQQLCEKNLMTDLGKKAVETAKQNGMWDASPSGAISDEQISAFEDKLSTFLPARENFMAMPRSAKVAYVRRYLSPKNEDTRQRHFEMIVDMLNNNQKPNISSKK